MGFNRLFLSLSKLEDGVCMVQVRSEDEKGKRERGGEGGGGGRNIVCC